MITLPQDVVYSLARSIFSKNYTNFEYNNNEWFRHLCNSAAQKTKKQDLKIEDE